MRWVIHRRAPRRSAGATVDGVGESWRHAANPNEANTAPCSGRGMPSARRIAASSSAFTRRRPRSNRDKWDGEKPHWRATAANVWSRSTRSCRSALAGDWRSEPMLLSWQCPMLATTATGRQARLPRYPTQMITRTRLGSTLRSLREAVGLTQADISRAIGVSIPVISRIENGIREPHATRLYAWAEACGCEVQIVRPNQRSVSTGQLSESDSDLIANMVAMWPELHPQVQAQLRAQMRVWKAGDAPPTGVNGPGDRKNP